MRRLSRQVDLARFYAKPEEMNESSGQHIGKTEVRNGCLDKTRAD
jgi:hypothetical protein